MQVKQTKTLQCKPLKEAIHSPGEFLFSDFSKFGRSEVIHLAFQALDQFYSKHNCYPEPHYENHAQEFLNYAKVIIILLFFFLFIIK